MGCQPLRLGSLAMGGRWKAGVVTVALFGALALVPIGGVAHAATAATFTAQGSVEQVYVIHATAGGAIELHDGAGATVQQAIVDNLGSALFRDVAPGDGYTVVAGGQESGPLHVMSQS